MAAVQDLFKRFKLRRSMKKGKKHDSKEDISDIATPRLADRIGVALPPVPPPAFRNLPDISRDCAHSPSPQVYEEIPAYAIDTRLDILRDAYRQRKANEAAKKSAAIEDRSRHTGYHGEQRWTSEYVPQRHHSLPREEHSDWRRQEVHRMPRRRGTPWQRGYDSDGEESGNSDDQLDKWVSVQESINALSTEDVRINTRTQFQHGQWPWYGQDMHSNVQRQSNHVPSDFSASVAHIPKDSNHQGEHSTSVPQDMNRVSPATHQIDNIKYPSPTPETLSDDSGMSSPSNGKGRVTPWGSKSVPRLFHAGQYSDSDSSTYCGNPNTVGLPRWCDQDSGHSDAMSNMTSHSDVMSSHLDTSCSDTYNEYDHHDSSFSAFGSLPHSHRDESSMSPQEYMFYLGKINQNFTKTSDVKHLAGGNMTMDSFDLTSASSLSNMSEEIQQMSKEFKANVRVSSGSKQNSVQKHGLPRKHSASNASQSAFKPYASQRRNSTPATNPEATETTCTMTLADKLSCRVTTSKPRTLALIKGSTSHLPTHGQKATHSVLPQINRPSHNMLLSDIMRINHDRQILGLV